MPFDDLVARARGQGARAQARAAIIEKKRSAAAEQAPPAKRVKTGAFATLLMDSKASAVKTAEDVVAECFGTDMIFKVDLGKTFETAFSEEKKRLFEKLEFEEMETLLEHHVATFPVTAGNGGGLTKKEVLSYVLGGEMAAFVKNRPTFDRNYDKFFRHRQPEAAGLRAKADGIGAQVKEFVMDHVKKHADERRLSRVEDIADKLQNGEDKTSQEVRELRSMLHGVLRLLSPEQRATVLRDLPRASGNPQLD